MSNELIEIKKVTCCMDCDEHMVVRDPDPNDWFCADDEVVLCKLALPVEGSRFQQHRAITSACRPYNKRKETEVPDWCPKLPTSDRKVLKHMRDSL